MKSKGFTLVELIAVICLIALVMMLIVPNLSNLSGENNQKKFSTYEDMMVEYTRAYPNYKTKNYICLKDLDLEPLDGDTTCRGSVAVFGNSLVPYLVCTRNGKNAYTTPAPSNSSELSHYNSAKSYANYC